MTKKSDYNYKKLMDSDTFASTIDKLKKENLENISQIEEIVKRQVNKLDKINFDDAESQELDKREEKVKEAYDKLEKSLKEYKQAYSNFTEAIKDYLTEIIDDCNRRSD